MAFDGDNGTPDIFQLRFPVQLTDRQLVNGVWQYSWTEQDYDVDTGTYLDMDSPRTGDKLTGPSLREANNQLVPVPSYVWVTPKGIYQEDPWYEIDAGWLSQSLQISSTTTQTVTLKSGTVQAYPAAIYSLDDTGTWVNTTQAAWLLPSNDEVPVLNRRYHCFPVNVDTSANKVIVYALAEMEQFVQVTGDKYTTGPYAGYYPAQTMRFDPSTQTWNAVAFCLYRDANQ